MRDFMNILNENEGDFGENDPIIGCVIDPNGGIHAIKGLDDIMEIAESVHPELDQMWEDQWEPQGLEYPEEVLGYILEKGWIEVLGHGNLRVSFEKPSPAALSSFYRVSTDMKAETFVLNGVGNRNERVANVNLALTKMGG